MSGPFKVRVAPRTWVPVATLAEASRAVRSYLTEHDLGASRWGQADAPVRDASGRTRAIVSYNGRVWTPERDWRVRTEIVGAALDEEVHDAAR